MVSCALQNGTIIRTGIACKKFFYKNLLNSAYLWSRAQLAVNKKQNYFSLPDHRPTENLILVFGFYERTRKVWKCTCSWICKNYSYDYFHTKISQKILCKIFAIRSFFIDYLKHKIVNKTVCRTSSANLRQLCVHLLKRCPTAMIIFRGFQDFLIYLVKYFWSLVNSTNFTF